MMIPLVLASRFGLAAGGCEWIAIDFWRANDTTSEPRPLGSTWHIYCKLNWGHAPNPLLVCEFPFDSDSYSDLKLDLCCFPGWGVGLNRGHCLKQLTNPIQCEFNSVELNRTEQRIQISSIQCEWINERNETWARHTHKKITQSLHPEGSFARGGRVPSAGSLAKVQASAESSHLAHSSHNSCLFELRARAIMRDGQSAAADPIWRLC